MTGAEEAHRCWWWMGNKGGAWTESSAPLLPREREREKRRKETRKESEKTFLGPASRPKSQACAAGRVMRACEPNVCKQNIILEIIRVLF